MTEGTLHKLSLIFPEKMLKSVELERVGTFSDDSSFVRWSVKIRKQLEALREEAVKVGASPEISIGSTEIPWEGIVSLYDSADKRTDMNFFPDEIDFLRSKGQGKMVSTIRESVAFALSTIAVCREQRLFEFAPIMLPIEVGPNKFLFPMR